MRRKREPKLNAAAPEQEKRAIPSALAAHSWRPGQSGNPGGRSIEFADCQRLCREASPEAARRLIELMYSEDERVALMAADKVLDRAWGRPKEPDQPTSLEQRLAAMTPEERERDAIELVERIKARLAAVRAQAGGVTARDVIEGEATEVEEDRTWAIDAGGPGFRNRDPP